MIKVQISEDALQDLNDGFLFYEAQATGLGDYFAACLKADIEGLRISAGVHRVVYEDYHRLLSRVFPYGIFYTLSGEVAVIWAIIDLRRDPVWIREHLKE
jgi:plasmid stabilization system protein ParE